jgi:DNA-binding response OmpR family regulator
MRKQPAIEHTETVNVLSVSPHDEDHFSLHAIIGHSRWRMFTAGDLASAISLLKQHEISVLVCARDLVSETWIDVLEHVNALPNAPAVIVASRLADEQLWAEALNLGAWDVLARPLDRTEVIRSVHSAWRRWHDQSHMRAAGVKMMEAAR